MSIVLGQLSALLVMIALQNLLTEDQLETWGRRIPFVIGAVAGLTVMSLRRTVEKSQHFGQEQARAAGQGRPSRNSLLERPTEAPAARIRSSTAPLT